MWVMQAKKKGKMYGCSKIRQALWVPAVLAGLLLQNCTSTNNNACVDGEMGQQISVKIQRLEKKMANLPDTRAASAFVSAYPTLAHVYFYMGVRTATDSNQVLEQLVAQAKDPYIDTMRRDVFTFFPTVEPLEKELGILFGRLTQTYPSFTPPTQVYTMASGFSIDVLYLDSVLIFGLEHFTPDTAHYQTPNMPLYKRERMRPNTLVPGLARLLSDRFIKTTFSPEPVLIEEVIRWGKVLYFQKHMLPCLPDTLLYGYSNTILSDVNKNSALIYAHFIDNSLFYSTDHLLRSKYVGERPDIPEIGPKCPGRVGQWLGYKIVQKWAADKGLTLQQVLEEPSAQKIFSEAKWKP